VSLKEKIKNDLKEAMQSQNTLRVSVLRLVLSAIANKEKEKRAKLSKSEEESKLEELSQLSDEEVTEVLFSEVKKRKESIKQYQEGGREDLAQQEKKELEILNDYLPQQMSEEEIREIVKDKIKESGASGPQDTGKVMGVLMPQLKGKAEGALVSQIVQEELKKLSSH